MSYSLASRWVLESQKKEVILPAVGYEVVLGRHKAAKQQKN